MAATNLGAFPLGTTQAASLVITATGVTNYGFFQPQAKPDRGDHTMTVTATGATALPTTLTVDLEVSPDGGTTWEKQQTGIALVASTAVAVQKIVNIVTGLLYRFNPTTYTAGSSTGATIFVTFN